MLTITEIYNQYLQPYLMPFIHLTLEMAPYLLLGFLVAGLLHGFVPRRFYGRYLAGNKLSSVMNAALLGVPLPLCSCGVIPTAMSLRRNGASKGSTVAFLISTPQTGVDSILATGALMGWTMALLRPCIAFITGILGGQLSNVFDKGNNDAQAVDSNAETLAPTFMGKVKASLRYGFIDMMQDIGKWLVVGLVIAGLITVFVPDNFFESLNAFPLLNMLVVLLIAVPMYVCATGSIPIAVALILKGLSPGAALVFLMAGPATNMAAILVINKVLGRKSLIIYISTIVCCAILAGLAIDFFVPDSLIVPYLTPIHTCHQVFPLWKIICGIVFIVLLCTAFIIKSKHSHNIEMNTTHTLSFNVKGMMCNHCRANVEKNVASLTGVETVDVNLEKGTLTVTGNASPETICNTVEQLGYQCTPA